MNDQDILDLQRRVAYLETALNAMRGNVAGRQLLERGAAVADLGTAARSDTAGVRNGQQHFYISGASIVHTVFDYAAQAWRTI